MEGELENTIEELMQERGVIGVICTDKDGLALRVDGSACESHAGLISGLSQEAKKLYPEIDPAPVICLESDTCNLLIKHHDTTATGIFKVPS